MSRPLSKSVRAWFESSTKRRRPAGREIVRAVARCAAESLEDRRLFAVSGATLSVSPTTINEGQSITWSSVVTADATAFGSLVVSTSDGRTIASQSAVLNAGPSSNFPAPPFVFTDDGPSPGNGTASDVITVTATWTQGASTSTATQTITVNNVAPSNLVVGPTAAIVEGNAATFTGSFTDPGTGDVHFVTLNWGDGSPASTVTVAAGQTTFATTHTYLDDGPSPGNGSAIDNYTVSAGVSDDDLGSTTAAPVVVSVANDAPDITSFTPNAVTVNEGGTVTFSATFTDAGVLDVHFATINWGDGSANTVQTIAAGVTTLTATHTYLDDGVSPGNGTTTDTAVVSLTLTDDDGGPPQVALSSATINNVAPAGVTVAATTFTEGTPGTLTGSFSDPGVLDVHVVVVNFNDATAPVTQTLAAGVTTFNVVHTFLDDGASPGNGTPSDLQSVSVTVTDDDTGTASGGGTVTVNNVAPSAVAAAPVVATINENGTATVTGSFTDPGTLDLHTVTLNWGDGATSTLALAAGVTTFTATHQYLDDGASPGNGTASDVYTVGITVADDDTGTGTGSTAVTVANVAPSAFVLNPIAAVNENGVATATGSFADPGTLDRHFVTLNWGDGGVSTVTVAAGVTTFSATHQYLDDGTSPGNATASDVYTVSATVSDDDTGTAGPVAQTVTVNNVAPSALVLTAPASVNEMQAFTLTGSFTDPGTLDVHVVTVDWADGNVEDVTLAAGVTTFSLAHTYVDDNPGAGPADYNTISVTVDDDDLGTTSGTKAVQVKNVAPVASNTGDATGVPGQLRTVVVGATDVSPVDQAAGFKFTVDWGDGTPVAVLANAQDPTALQHAWSKTGTFTITVRATDKDLGTSLKATRKIVIKQVDLQADPCDPNLTALVVGDTSGSNKIEFLAAAGGAVQVKVNGAGKGTFLFDGRIVAYGNDGNDTISVSSAITKSAWVFAGKGNDTVTGGSGDDFVDGGRGNDKIYGRDGRDVLVGGGDTDTIVGGNGDDVLIAALSLVTTPAEYNEQICAIMDEWTSGASYADRVDHLVNGDGLNGSVRLAPDTVSSDPKAADTLTGGADQDLFYLNPANVGSLKDKITDLAPGEIPVYVGNDIP